MTCESQRQPHEERHESDNDDEGDDEMRDEVFIYIQELASQYPFVNWYFDGARL